MLELSLNDTTTLVWWLVYGLLV